MNKDDDAPKPLGGADRYPPKPAGTLETKAHRIARLRAKQAALNSKARTGIGSLESHSERLAQLAEVERELKALGEVP